MTIIFENPVDPGASKSDDQFILKSHLRALLIAQEDGMPGIELPAYKYIVDDEKKCH